MNGASHLRTKDRSKLRPAALRAVEQVADPLGIQVFTEPGYGLDGSANSRARSIILEPRHATAYTVLHEVGHVLVGSAIQCCREHDEYAAHGVAIALARMHGFRLTRKVLSQVEVWRCSTCKQTQAHSKAITQKQRRRRRGNTE